MPQCPNCHAPLTPGRLMRISKQRFPCEACGVALNINALYVLLPVFALIFLGAPLAKSVEAGVVGLVPALVGGVLLLVVLTLVGYATATVRLADESGRSRSRRVGDLRSSRSS